MSPTDGVSGTGQRGSVQVKAKDPRGLESTATFQLAVTATNRAKPVANDDVEDNAAAGKPVTVKVLANDSNPFPDTAAEDHRRHHRNRQGNVAISGDSVTVTPSAGFTGTMVVSYTVADKTEDASRNATARIRLTVKDKPLAPTTPQAQSVGDRTALLNWSAPADRGSPITKYTVYGSRLQAGLPGQHLHADRPRQQHQVPLRGHGHQRVRRVGPLTRLGGGAAGRQTGHAPGSGPQVRRQAARGELGGTCQQGIASQVLRPGNFTGTRRPERPDPEPDAPSATSGRDSRTGCPTRCVSWPGMMPRNRPSGAHTPRPRCPPACRRLRLRRVLRRPAPVGAQSQLKVSWTAPNNNGDAVSSYTLTTLRGGAAVASQPGGFRHHPRTSRWTIPRATTPSPFRPPTRLAPPGPARRPRRSGQPASRPGEQRNCGRDRLPRPASGDVHAADQAQRNGSTASEIAYTYNADGESGSIPAGGGTVGGLTNGRDITVTSSPHPPRTTSPVMPKPSVPAIRTVRQCPKCERWHVGKGDGDGALDLEQAERPTAAH